MVGNVLFIAGFFGFFIVGIVGLISAVDWGIRLLLYRPVIATLTFIAASAIAGGVAGIAGVITVWLISISACIAGRIWL